MDTNLGLSILCVEDDPDTCEVIVELLRREGYDVAAAPNAEQALRLLAAKRYNLVISDYMLPDLPGTQMLRKALAMGLLGGVPILIFTAHPSPEKVEGAVVVRKPLAVDMFLRTVYDILAPAREVEMEKAKQSLKQLQLEKVEKNARVEFILYVSAASPASLRALRNMQDLLSRYDMDEVQFMVVDLSKETPASVDEDRIAFTPTLVQRKPEPRTWILGDLQNIHVVADLLVFAGVTPRK